MSGYKKTKPEKTQRHARQRAYERHGITLTYDEEKQICRDIEAGDALFSGKGRNGVSAYDVIYNGRLIRVLYSAVYKKLVTVLPSQAIAREGC